MGRDFREDTQVGKSVTLCLPEALGLKEDEEMILREDDGRYACEPTPVPKRFIDLTCIYGACPDLKPLAPEERMMELHELDRDGAKPSRG